MPIERSVRACKLCRQRRVKCDKTLPICKRCEDSGRTCPGYPHQRVFVDQTMRYGFGSHTSPYQGDLIATGFGVNDLIVPNFTPDSQPEYVSSNNSIVGLQEFHTPSNNNLVGHLPPVQFQSPRAQDTISVTLQQTTSPIGGSSDQDWEYFDLDIDTYYANGNNACGFFADAGEFGATALSLSPDDPNIGSSNSLSEERDGMTIPKEELAPLMRLFVEILAPWMDLFDIDAYFSRTLPHHASLDVLLQFALAAVASKQAARYLVTQGLSPSGRILDQIMASHTEKRSTEWFFKAARYYDQGISSLRDVLTKLPDAGLSTAMGLRSYGNVIEKSTLQNVLSAISIFSFYENLDDCLTKTSKHLVGFLALLSASSDPPPSPRQEEQYLLASRSAGRAAFWYFARKEMFAAYINHTCPAVDPDLELPWVKAGLPETIFTDMMINSEETCVTATTYSHGYDHMIMVHVLIWLTTKVVKFVAERDSLSSTQIDGSPILNAAFPSQNQTKVWSALRHRLRQWHHNRPQVFQAYATSEVETFQYGRTINKTMSFTSSMGAAAMQIYHFAQLLLLLNQPHDRSWARSHAHRLHALRQNAVEVEAHSRDICAIAFCVPASNIQRQMSHPLQLAGVCFDDAEDRKAITNILKDAAAETCSAPEEMLQCLSL